MNERIANTSKSGSQSSKVFEPRKTTTSQSPTTFTPSKSGRCPVGHVLVGDRHSLLPSWVGQGEAALPSSLSELMFSMIQPRISGISPIYPNPGCTQHDRKGRDI